ncbi:hypothetical protein [uncultured Planktomarina sp.]|uniref:hypothetical protein n=1 Tax=uncultured Planktomarina sp. TaxID=1538529 RepID=UPI003260FA9B
MKRLLASIAPAKIKRALSKKKKNMPLLDYDLTRFDEQDIILESEAQIQEFLPDILGQALARTWVDKRFLDAFYDQPKEILERAGVFLPKSISVEFIKKDNERPKVIVYQKKGSKSTRLLELKLVMVAAT